MDNKKDNSNRVWSIEQLQLAIELESANPNQLAKKSLYTLYMYIYWIPVDEKKRINARTMRKTLERVRFAIGSACERISRVFPEGGNHVHSFHRNKSRPPLTISTGPHRNPHCWGTNGGGPSFSVDDRVQSTLIARQNRAENVVAERYRLAVAVWSCVVQSADTIRIAEDRPVSDWHRGHPSFVFFLAAAHYF